MRSIERSWAWLKALDWHVVLMLGPRHKFSPAQWMQLDKGLPGISPSVKLAALISALSLLAVLTWMPDAELQAAGMVIELLVLLLTLRLAAWIWRRPTRRSLYLAYLAIALLLALGSHGLGLYAGLTRLAPVASGGSVGNMAMVLMLVAFYSLWVLAMWRNEYLADWLHDHALREHSAELARQLSSAQIQPHFLFNSLASLQHWVESKDERAAPMLASLTAYLRATLPLFDRPLLTLREEAEAVQRYLEVMQARVGERLRFRVEISEAAAARQLPPGLLLTLVENAVEHGVQPRLSGGEVMLRAAVQADGSLLAEVLDDGPGLDDELHIDTQTAPADAASGHGLRNSALRLAQAFGARGMLRVMPAAGGGCLAQVRVGPDAANH